MGLFKKPTTDTVVDPVLTAQEKAAEEARLLAIRGGVSSQTDALMRAFGSRRVFGGSGFTRAPIIGL